MEQLPLDGHNLSHDCPIKVLQRFFESLRRALSDGVIKTMSHFLPILRKKRGLLYIIIKIGLF